MKTKSTKKIIYIQFLPNSIFIGWYLRLITVLIFIFVLTTCVTNSHTKSNKRFKLSEQFIIDNNLQESNHITRFKLIHWKPLDDRHLIISSSFNKYYLVTLKSYCNNLRSSINISTKQHRDYVLSNLFDAIIVDDTIPQECLIKTFHILNKEQQNELYSIYQKSY